MISARIIICFSFFATTFAFSNVFQIYPQKTFNCGNGCSKTETQLQKSVSEGIRAEQRKSIKTLGTLAKFHSFGKLGFNVKALRAQIKLVGEENQNQRNDQDPKLPIWNLLRPQRKNILVSMVFGLLGSFISVLFPIAFSRVLDALLSPALSMSRLYKAMATMSILYFLEPITTYMYVRQMTYVKDGIITKLKLDAFQRILSQDMSFFDERSLGEIVGTITTDINNIKTIWEGNLSRDRGFRALTEVLLGSVILGTLNWQLGLIFSTVIPVAATLCAQFKKFFFMVTVAQSKSLKKEATQTNEIVRNIREVRSFGTENMEFKRFQKSVLETADMGVKVGKGAGKLESYNRAAIYISIMSVILAGSRMVANGTITAPFLVPFIGFCFSMNFAIQGLNMSYADMKRAITGLENIYSVMNLKPPTSTLGDKKIPENELKGDIELKDVEFVYPARPDIKVFKNLNLKLKAGTVTALVGESGAGKSTITSLLSGFYEPSRGQISLDGVDLKELDRSWKTKQVALVGQQPALFSGSIAENIAYGSGLIDRETSENGHKISNEALDKIVEAAKRANAHNFISNFPEGYNTLVGEGGIQLSGGQKQRIAIARAIMKNSKILILDEATSALDAESEALVQEALENLMKGRTVLVIAHRLSTVVNADKICVIKDGLVFEEGTHKELMNKDGAYSKLMKTQTQHVVEFIPETPQEPAALSTM